MQYNRLADQTQSIHAHKALKTQKIAESKSADISNNNNRYPK
jgi:hypothetical protein